MFSIDYKNPMPIYEQLVEKIESFIFQGVFKADEQLPSVRQLAMDLSINPNTIQKAYSMLDAKGMTYSVKGRGIFVSSDYQKAKDTRIQVIKEDILDLTKQAESLGVTRTQVINWIDEY